MNVMLTELHQSKPWWQHLGEGLVEQPPRTWASPARLESIIAARRAECSARMKKLRGRSERGIARLINHNGS
jgi:hypothetical protein